ncbi:hypothetical protein A5711_22760 [Mycobacterium sp. E2238]|nr:hypothetical protein A5711_22760 [Mycobacterium sp. E2238]
MTLSTDPANQPVTLDLTGETSPYPFFEYMRRTDPVWHGSLSVIQRSSWAAGKRMDRRDYRYHSIDSN